MKYSILKSESKQPWVLFEIHKIGFRGNKNIPSGAKWPITTNQAVRFDFLAQCKLCFLDKDSIAMVQMVSQC